MSDSHLQLQPGAQCLAQTRSTGGDTHSCANVLGHERAIRRGLDPKEPWHLDSLIGNEEPLKFLKQGKVMIVFSNNEKTGLGWAVTRETQNQLGGCFNRAAGTGY